MDTTLPLYAAGASAAAYLAWKIKTRLDLSRAKHPSLAGHSRMARRMARLIPYYEYDESEIFAVDSPPGDILDARRTGFDRLSEIYRQKYARSSSMTREAAAAIPDLQFTGAYRVPFQFSRYVRARLGAGSFVESSNGVRLLDLDGNAAYDLAGSYGVNVFGYDFYKLCLTRASERMRNLGPVLGFLHPVVADNVQRLRVISGLDDVSFHMSGTEAVMQAVRLARYHTRRNRVVRFCGAYHGWWGDVQPGVGNPLPARDTYTLKEMDGDTLRVLRTRRDIACVLVNPLQALHPNAGAPSDSSLVDGSRAASYDRAAYAQWLGELRSVCTQRGIVLIFDEVFVGFRLAKGGAQEYFGVKADLVTYGKTLGGGLPIGVVCGRSDLMKRFRDDRPADICFARGTFNSHPYVMAAMNEFLRRIDTPETASIYARADAEWNDRADALNRRLEAEGLPVRVANLHSIWTVLYTRPSRFNWMLQYYLRVEGLALSWVGTGRFIFSLDYTESDFEAVANRFIAAAHAMDRDGWWWHEPGTTNKTIKRKILWEMLPWHPRRPTR